MKRILPYFIAIAALALAGTSAYYSIFGLSKFYAGAANAVILMGIAIEASKVIATSVLHQYHKVLSWPIKIYLTLAIVLSMIITSAGIYGFLTNAYQQTATKVELLDGEISVIENKKTYFKDNINRTQSIIDGKNNRINTLSTVRSQQEQRLQTLYDSKSTAAAKRTEALIKDADKQINKLTIEVDSLNVTITSLNDSISALDKNILDKNTDSDVAGEVGPLRFISKLTGASMNTVVNWFTILLILIFDPLAVALIIVLNRITKKDNDTPTPINVDIIPPKPIIDNDTQITTQTDVWDSIIDERKSNIIVEDPVKPEDVYDEKSKPKKRKRSGKPVYW
jgi:hypothetical protein